MTTDCICGVCGPCRREDRLMRRRVTGPVVLSERAVAILAEPPFYEPPRSSGGRPARKNPQARRTVATGRASRSEGHVPVPCIDCGEMRIIVKLGRGTGIAGADGRCELCRDTPAFTKRVADHHAGVKELTSNELMRLTRCLGRTMKDGRPFHPGVEVHGITGYNSYGCRCGICCQSRTVSAQKIKQRKALSA